jgi:hypothetical protein
VRRLYSVGRSVAAGLGAVACLLVATAAPAAAQNQQPVTVSVACIVPASNGTYRAVFGYTSPTTKYNIPVSGSNQMTPQSLDGIQTTKFDIGSDQGAFITPPIAAGQQVTWRVVTSVNFPASTATASSSSTPCGPPVSLPAEGNGTGPVVIVAASLLVTFLVLALRRRPAKQTATAHPAQGELE